MGLFWDCILIFLQKGTKSQGFFLLSEDCWQLRNLQRFLWDGRRNQGSTLLLLRLLWLSHLAKADYFGNSGCAEEWKWSAPFNCQATFPAPGNTSRAVLSQSLARIFPCQYNPLEIRSTGFVCFCVLHHLYFFFLIELIFKPQNRWCSAKKENKTKYEILERYGKICNMRLETKT